MTIATSVARAYRVAVDVEDLNQSLWTRIQEKKEHLVLRLLDRDSFAALNISPAEDTALQQLVDALGAAVEFQPPGTFQPVTDYRDGGPHGLAPGEWTDDTSMALALADSIAIVGWDLNDQLDRYVSWWKLGKYSVNDECFDIGIATKAALSRFTDHGDARRSGSTDEHSSGNGSIMRLAPVPIRNAGLFADSIEELSRFAAESSLTTHASEQCLSACRYMTLVLAG